MAGMDTNVALDTSVVAQLIEHIRNKSTDRAEQELRVPASQFTCPDRARAEIALLKTCPLVIGHASEVPQAGDFITRDLLGASVIVSRGKDGRIATFRNMCPHRGGRVEQKEAGRKHIFMCQYHGWSFNAEDGALRPVPYEDSFGPIDYACSGLQRIRTEVRHGLIFVDLSDNCERDIASFLGAEVEAQLAPWQLDQSRVYLDKSFTVPINWKLVMDGAVDSLHAQYLHPGPGNVGARTLTNIAVFRAFGPHGRLFVPRTRMKKLVDQGEEAAATTNYVASIMLLYPNALMAAAPDHVEFWTVWPSANPAECTVRIRFFVRPEILSPEMEERIDRSWAILENAATTEDWPMEVWIQENAMAWPDTAFRYGRNEVSAQHLHHELIRALAAS
ncbi:MAG TPA: aromatic ring-hydroxylating dioxygenase subunit alpha [Novosphingobium sp.]|nr:aromatic ring-hydroxylating dioxygenase subunit alpha [Novosphingobium sp.]HZV08904.1 aromatic ring-hydroxylating dioxygenase subunit alpha [Novosphingobium sp.]